ncbi:MAG: response regulator [Chloroflexota bacterium]
MTRPIVFISYSHQDEVEKNQLLSHLGVLEKAGLIDPWSDDRIGAGQDWQQAIERTMAQAQVAILLITVNFLTSDFILHKEAPALLKRCETAGLIVFPVIAKDCAWRMIDWLATMNVRPKNGRPVWGDGGSHVDEDLAAIAEEVAEIIKKMGLELDAGRPPQGEGAAGRPEQGKPRCKRYHLKNIRALLSQGLTKDELRRLCYDTDAFRPVYDELTSRMSKARVIDKIVEYADQKLQLETLLRLARDYSGPARYEQHKPYIVPPRILLVDDNPFWREQLGGLLQERYGYDVVTAASKPEAIQAAKSGETFGLAIIDMRLDEKDESNREGVELGFWLRDNGFEDLPIIIMTAYDMEAEIARNITLRPFQFSVVEKRNIGSGHLADLLRQVELALR